MNEIVEETGEMNGHGDEDEDDGRQKMKKMKMTETVAVHRAVVKT